MGSYAIHACLGVDIGTSGIRILLLNKEGNTIKNRTISYRQLEKVNVQIWDEENRIHLLPLIETLYHLISELDKKVLNVQVQSLSISSIGPSLVLISEKGNPLCAAYTYAYKGAHDFVNLLPNDFQKRTGGMLSGALPYVQLLKLIEDDQISNCYKITTINDYITWYLSSLPLSELFSTLPNASYTGLYSMKNDDWDWELLKRLKLKSSTLPKIIPLGSIFPLSKNLSTIPLLKHTQVVAGTIDGIDAFWATEGRNEEIVIGSASTTGALRRWRYTRKLNFNSGMIQCINIDNNSWVELIPFNNVGTSFTWLATNFKKKFNNYLTKTQQLNIEKLEEEIKRLFHLNNKISSSYLSDLPLFFPYIEGEPRGPQGRGNIKGGFIFENNTEVNTIDLYVALILGIAFMFRHNFDVLFSQQNFIEIRLTGLIARKSPFFLTILATLTKLNVIIMKKEQSVTWATAMRSLAYILEIKSLPKLETYDPISPLKGEVSDVLNGLYSRYLKVYSEPTEYVIVTSEKELMEN
ncbi:MAG: FGGY family carbohydrate kinase [Candidatus Hodarchaeales archaeon]|jgi:sugar (pentulose or hexulose) kinase